MDLAMDLAIYSQVVKCSTVGELQSLMREHNITVHFTRNDGISLLHTFALLGSYDICKYLYSNGARPTLIQDNSTVFHSAVKAKNPSEDAERADILKLFLDKDIEEVDVNHRNEAGWTALKLAARRSLEKCVELLLSNGADPNIPDNEEFTSIHNAVTRVDILKLLLTKCSNVNARNNRGETPLCIAVEKNSNECAMTLLEHNADPNIGDNEGVTPLFLATKDGNLKLTEVLVKAGANVNACGAKQNVSPLHWAAHKENNYMALFLIKNGADIFQVDNEGRTPLSMASPALAEQMIATAKSLNPGIDVASTNNEAKLSAADKAVAACCGGNVQALTVLIESGVSVNHITGESRSTLLHMAAYCGQLPVVAYLLSMEANLTALDNDQDTVLHVACMKHVSHGMHEKTLQLLLGTPAKSLINELNNKGDTPIMVATRCGFSERVKLLLKHKADFTIANKKKELPFHRACSSTSNIELVMMFAELSRDINVQDEDGWTPLMFAAKSGSAAVVKYLLQRGAKPNLRQNSGFTALYLAAQDNHVSSCCHLLEANADPNITGGPQRLSPLHIAAHRNEIETCKVLMEYGGDPFLKDGDGDTPLDLVISPELKTYMQHVYERTSNKNRRQGNLPGHQSHDGDMDHVISNEETITNEATDPVNVISRNVTTDDVWKKREEEYCARISHLTRLIEFHSIREKELSNNLTELQGKYKSLQGKYKSLQESSLPQRDRYKRDRDGQQRKLESTADVTLLSTNLQRVNISSPLTPHSNTLQQVDHRDIKLKSTSSEDLLFPHFAGTYRNMEVTVATLDYKQAKNVSAVMSELAQLSAIRCSHLIQLLATAVDNEHHMIYLVYENIGITTLSNLIHFHGNQNVTWKQRMHLLWDITVGMDHLHTMNPFIGHYCLRPSVVQVCETATRMRARIGCYGLTQVLNNYNIASAHMIKIVPYLAPEILQNTSHVKSSDTYSFGMLMYETLTEYVPYSDTGGSSVVVLVHKIISGAKLVYPKLAIKYEVHEQAIKEATSIITSCHSNARQERPSFSDLVSSLKSLL